MDAMGGSRPRKALIAVAVAALLLAFAAAVAWMAADSMSKGAAGDAPSSGGGTASEGLAAAQGADAPTGVEMPDGSLYGNAPGNSPNGGTAAASGGWVYYVNESDRMRLYKVRDDGAENGRVTDQSARCVNMYGGWVYFIDRERCVSRMLPDGSGVEQVTGLRAYWLSIVDGWMYVVRRDPGERDENGGFQCGEIWKMRPDGSGAELLREEPSGQLVAYGGRLYFCSPHDAENGDRRTLYRMGLDGGGLEELADDAFIYVPAGDWVFYNGPGEQGLYRMGLDGSDPQLVCDANPMSLSAWGGDWVYYVDYVDASTRPAYRVNVETLERQLIVGEDCLDVSVVGDRILVTEQEGEYDYFVPTRGSASYLADPDGSNMQLIE